MSESPLSDRDLLREVYRHLDRKALLAKHPELTAKAVQSFFGRLDRLLPKEKALPTTVPKSGAVILHTDGGSRGNPGPAGYGLVLTDASGAVLLERGGFLGRATNNEAEYAGLCAGLKAALEAGAKELLIRSDSELLVRQINGAYKVKSRRLLPLFTEARGLLDRFASWRAEHVRREANSRADALANEAMGRGRRG